MPASPSNPFKLRAKGEAPCVPNVDFVRNEGIGLGMKFLFVRRRGAAGKMYLTGSRGRQWHQHVQYSRYSRFETKLLLSLPNVSPWQIDRIFSSYFPKIWSCRCSQTCHLNPVPAIASISIPPRAWVTHSFDNRVVRKEGSRWESVDKDLIRSLEVGRSMPPSLSSRRVIRDGCVGTKTWLFVGKKPLR